jgi:hypothetical protein
VLSYQWGMQGLAGPKGQRPKKQGEGGNMNITMEYLILVVIESILVASILGLVFYYLLTWVA